MAINKKLLNEELSNMKKWSRLLEMNDNTIDVGDTSIPPAYRESMGESSEMTQPGAPESEIAGQSGYMEMAEEEAVEDDLYEFTIPEWAMSALINGDTSGLNDDDEKKLNRFIGNIISRYGNANFTLPKNEDLDLGFCRPNDIDGLGCNCQKLMLRTDKGKHK